MNRRPSFRGQPLLLLGGLVLGWGALRMASWEAPWPALPAAPATASRPAAPPAPVPRDDAPAPGEPWLRRPLPAEPLSPARWQPLAVAGQQDGAAFNHIPWQVADAAMLVPPQGAVEHAVAPTTLIGSEVLMLAGLSQMQVPGILLAYLQPGTAGRPALAAAPQAGVPQAAAPAGVAPLARSTAPASRWSSDAWLLLRDDTSSPLTAGRPSYGRSQAGAVVRYRLGTGAAAPQAYLRASTALAGAREQEVAAGLSLRPVPGLPVRLAAEARVNDNRAGTSVRPAVFAVTELPPVALPAGTRGEVYLQGGYVGGDFATGFVDGQARLDRQLLQRGRTEVSVGAGAWGGAQEGSSRLDVGPSVGVTFGLGRVRGRVAADYRLRVAGAAEPASGPALTIAAGF